MADDFEQHGQGLDSPARNALVITPDDNNDLAKSSRAVYIGTSGDLKVDMVGGNTAVVFTALPVGIMPIRVSRIYSTDTPADNIVSLW